METFSWVMMVHLSAAAAYTLKSFFRVAASTSTMFPINSPSKAMYSCTGRKVYSIDRQAASVAHQQPTHRAQNALHQVDGFHICGHDDRTVGALLDDVHMSGDSVLRPVLSRRNHFTKYKGGVQLRHGLSVCVHTAVRLSAVITLPVRVHACVQHHQIFY